MRAMSVFLFVISFASPAAAKCTVYEAAVFSLIEEAQAFQKSPRFRELGWSPAGPANGWLDRMRALQTEENKQKNFQFFAKYGFGIGEVYQVADEYRTAGTLDTFYRQIEDEIKNVEPCE